MYNRVSAYLEQEILSASSLQLVHILYQSAISELRDARRNMASRQIAAKCANFNQACVLIGELLSSLDMEAGQEIATRLKALYEYMLARLLEANMRNLDEPVAQVIALLSTLDEGWKEIANPKPPVERESSMAACAVHFGAADVDAPAQIWSF